MLIKKAHYLGNVSLGEVGHIQDVVLPNDDRLLSQAAMEQFSKLVAEVKKVAPKSSEFCYFTCRAITAAEAANYDKQGNYTGDGHYEDDGKWVSSQNIIPYMNNNGDVFPEEELKKSYKSFIGKGLFVNHSSEDVEKVRGIILDAVWVPEGKHIQLLCALDEIAHPTLARQVRNGYTRDVSMGTAVKYSICSICANKAITEEDYCHHIKDHKGLWISGEKAYESNFGLNFIEISLVTQGADPQAKIRTVIASLNKIAERRESNIIEHYGEDKDKLKSDQEYMLLQGVRSDLIQMNKRLNELDLCRVPVEGSSYDYPPYSNIPEGAQWEGTGQGNEKGLDTESESAKDKDKTPPVRPAHDDTKELVIIAQQISDLSKKLGCEVSIQQDVKQGVTMLTAKERESRRQKRTAYFLGTEEPTAPETRQYSVDPLDIDDRLHKDKQMVGGGMEPGREGLAGQGTQAGPDLPRKEQLLRAEEKLTNRRTGMLNKDQITDRRKKREAYFQGTEEPTAPGTRQYEVDPTAIQNRDQKDKQMIGVGMEPGATGLAGQGYSEGPDLPRKEKLQRAKLRARFIEGKTPQESEWTVFADVTPILRVTAEEAWGDQLSQKVFEDSNLTAYDYFKTEAYGLDVIKSIRSEGFEKTAYYLKGVGPEMKKEAQDIPLPAPKGDMMAPGLDRLDGLDGLEGLEEGKEEVELTPEEQIQENLDAFEAMTAEIRELLPQVGEVDEFADLGGMEDEFEGASAELGLVSKLDDKKKKVRAAQIKEAYEDSNDLIKFAKERINAAKTYVANQKGSWNVNDSVEHTAFGKGVVTSLDEGTMDVNFGTIEKPDIKTLMASSGKVVSLKKVASVPEPKVGSPEWLTMRKQARSVFAEEKYDVNGGLQPQGPNLIRDAHKDHLNKNIAPSGSGDGGVVENIIEQQEKDLAVVNKQPTGELTAAEKAALRKEGATKCSECGCVDCTCKDCSCPECVAMKKEASLKKEAAVKCKHCSCDCKDCNCKNCSCDKCGTTKTASTFEVVEPPFVAFAKMDKEGLVKLAETDIGAKKFLTYSEMDQETLKKLAEVDAEAKKYWTELYGQGDSASKEFAKDLTAEFKADQQKTASNNEKKAYALKVQRSYDLALDMQEKGLIAEGKEAREAQVEKILRFDDGAFDAFKESIAAVQAAQRITTASLKNDDGVNQAPRVGLNQERQDGGFAQQLGDIGWS